MHTSYWKTGIAALLTGLLLGAGVSAQEGASGDVTIKNEKPAVATSSASSADADKIIKPAIVDRDPFINQLQRDGFANQDVRPRPNPRPLKPDNSSQAPKARPDADPIATNTEVPIEVPAPEVKVTGIVVSSSGSQAIISTGQGMRMITTGQKLGDYRVSAIGADYVAFSYGGEKVFKVPMSSEF